MMREKIPTVDFTSLHQDIAAVMFFNNIYPRADEYFNSLKAKMSGKLSQTLMELDSEIMILQQHEKEMNELKIKCETLEHRNSELSEKVHTCERKNILIETEKNELSGQVETLQLKMGEMSSQKDA
jgi:predicted nuclease with TOPRIM domain